jgi:HKD family nuclease
MKEMITVEKEVYEAVLRNSVRVNDLEAVNQQLKELLKECKNYINKVAFCTPNCYKTLMEDLLTKIDKV